MAHWLTKGAMFDGALQPQTVGEALAECFEFPPGAAAAFVEGRPTVPTPKMLESDWKQPWKRDSRMSIGFIGLGNIGRPMACQLLRLGEELWGYDVAAVAVAELAARGGRGGARVRDLAERCRIIGVCVRDEPEVSSVLHGDDGLLAHAQPDAIIAVHSTVNQAAILGWA